MTFNDNFKKLPSSYVFAALAEKKREATEKSGRETIDLGIGDVSLPLFKIVADEMKKAAAELAEADKFKGYPPATGYDFLKDEIIADYEKHGIRLTRDEIFINDGAKGELFAINSLLGKNSRILFPVPCYPAGVETAVICGNQPIFLSPDENGDYLPPFGKPCEAIYLCSPSNPSGKTLGKAELELWTAYAISVKATIFFDGAYSDYVQHSGIKSIFQIRGAKKCAAEIRSFSKGYGFTGLRLGYIVIPREQKELNALRTRLAGCSSNGVSYITQRGGAACFTPEGQAELKKRTAYYKTNAAILKSALRKVGINPVIGNDSPYVYAKCPHGFTEREFLGLMIEKAGVLAAPGSGFYERNGDYFRLSAFKKRSDVLKAGDGISALFNLST